MRALGQALRLRLARSWELSRLWYRLRGLRLEGRPEEDVWYFAYGANMHDSAFRERRNMRPREWRAGRIHGYRLRFNLEGRPKGKAAPANISPELAAEVWGVLYRISRRDLLWLDFSEGVPGRRYRHLWIEAEDAQGIPLAAVTYIAEGNAADGNPSLRYLTLLREGARAKGLPEYYLRLLDQVRHSGSGDLCVAGPQIEVTYDGACPVCRSFVHRFKPSDGDVRIALIDARAAPDRVAALAARGLDLDQGIVVKAGGSYLSGAEATRYLAGLHASSGWPERLIAWCFGSPQRAALAYPLFRACRRLLLLLLRRRPLA